MMYILISWDNIYSCFCKPLMSFQTFMSNDMRSLNSTGFGLKVDGESPSVNIFIITIYNYYMHRLCIIYYYTLVSSLAH